jgi:hypothetical protein
MLLNSQNWRGANSFEPDCTTAGVEEYWIRTFLQIPYIVLVSIVFVPEKSLFLSPVNIKLPLEKKYKGHKLIKYVWSIWFGFSEHDPCSKT